MATIDKTAVLAEVSKISKEAHDKTLALLDSLDGTKGDGFHIGAATKLHPFAVGVVLGLTAGFFAALALAPHVPFLCR